MQLRLGRGPLSAGTSFHFPPAKVNIPENPRNFLRLLKTIPCLRPVFSLLPSLPPPGPSLPHLPTSLPSFLSATHCLPFTCLKVTRQVLVGQNGGHCEVRVKAGGNSSLVGQRRGVLRGLSVIKGATFPADKGGTNMERRALQTLCVDWSWSSQ